MWNKIKQTKYLFLGQYFLLGIILGVFVYQFLTQSLLNQRIDLALLFDKETIGFLISCLVGGISGGIVYIIISLNDKTRVKRESNSWVKMKNAKISSLIFKAMFAFSMGAFVGMLAKKAMDLESYTNFMSSLFSSENMISYIGAVVAACVFAIPLSIGALKRLRLLYDN
ncbi:hypothetical protein DWB61_14930 [Ancylomarina euxinus]|uniref:Uncharacterized protein n=1 Tax=Ancylomarina euxinus TaxID=2283627 RepID=A0A425XXR0_9BACT|nr:hypothetical protein [Ancylomarina euxinus]MCZ4696010.1 hypothetical protein [Ancylomarina euxinus]MUP13949.1 hypothetical protein [Ancylomarina euxinus]RRG19505.1 hypothetical protein DWB61_14930 [Ancylomarina euxinus]